MSSVFIGSQQHHVTVGNKTLPGKEISFTFSYPVVPVTLNSSSSPTSADNNEYNTIKIDLFVDMGVGIGGDTWPAAELFCDYISSHKFYAHFSSMFHNKSILELGSGNGLVSIMIEKCFVAKEIIVTDMESHVGLIDHNLKTNHCQICTAESLDWFNIPSDGKKYDILLALEW